MGSLGTLEVTKGERKAEQAGMRSTTGSNYRTLGFNFIFWGSLYSSTCDEGSTA